MLQQTLRSMELPGVEKTSEVLDELTEKIKEAQARPKRGLKTQKVSICYYLFLFLLVSLN